MSIKKLYLSRHSKNRMRKFGITTEDIKKTIESSVLEEQSIKGRKNVWSSLGDKFIRVTCIEEELQTVIITVVIKENLPDRRAK